ncbi:toll/interleukin-1 receptor domain-containing protein [Cryptosporangium japonicum]|uniref:TIR domain-containing protein n=1 Tax=Cryptosporangium japonicum TaxID=80872 RepID=A0ABN0U8D2_9ACTN
MALPLTTYDVCLSFAGEDRAYVREVAGRLLDAGVRVFYDEHERIELWGRNLHDRLAEIYGFRSEYCVLFASEAYARQAWPNHERRIAQARAFSTGEDYILPVRMDDTEIPGLLATTAFVDARTTTAVELAGLIEEKLTPAPDRQARRVARERRAEEESRQAGQIIGRFVTTELDVNGTLDCISVTVSVSNHSTLLVRDIAVRIPGSDRTRHLHFLAPGETKNVRFDSVPGQPGLYEVMNIGCGGPESDYEIRISLSYVDSANRRWERVAILDPEPEIYLPDVQ